MAKLLAAILMVSSCLSTVTIYTRVSDAFGAGTGEGQRPLIGIFSLPLSKILQSKVKELFEGEPVLGPGEDVLNEIGRMSFIPASYARWVQEHGADVLPLDFNMDVDQLRALMDRTHGLLLTGGVTGLYNHDTRINLDSGISSAVRLKVPSAYVRKVGGLLSHAKLLNRLRTFPVWATCLGYEAMVLNEADFKIQPARVINLDVNRPLKFLVRSADEAGEGERENPEEEFFDSDRDDPVPLFDFLRPTDIEELEKQNLVFFNHENAFFPDTFARMPELRENFHVIAVSPPKSIHIKKDIVAIIMHKLFPFIASQFHPEKAEFEVGGSEHANHDPEAQRLAALFSKAFVHEARKGLASLPRQDERQLSDFKGYQIINTPRVGAFKSVYLLRKKDN